MIRGTIVHAVTFSGGNITGRYYAPTNAHACLVITVDGTEHTIHNDNLSAATEDDKMAQHNFEDEHMQAYQRIYGDKFSDEGINLTEVDYPIFTEQKSV